MEAMAALAAAGVPVGVSAAPMIPGLNDYEFPSILETVSEAGASFGFYSLVRLPGAVESIFGDWLEGHFPDGKEKSLARIRESHGGTRNQNIPGVPSGEDEVRQAWGREERPRSRSRLRHAICPAKQSL
jgi:DNA repair photolyase